MVHNPKPDTKNVVCVIHCCAHTLLNSAWLTQNSESYPADQRMTWCETPGLVGADSDAPMSDVQANRSLDGSGPPTGVIASSALG